MSGMTCAALGILYYNDYSILKESVMSIEGKNTERNKESAKPKANKKALAIKAISILAVVFFAIALIWYLTIHNYYNKMNIVNRRTGTMNEYQSETSEWEINGNEIEKILSEDNLSDEDLPDSTADEIDALELSIRTNMENQAEELMGNKKVFNILLIGCDAREEGGRGRADSIILISINKESEQLIATSIMRDIYVEIPGHGNDRINAAYAYGGADLLVETVEKNFKIQIDRYASVDFFVFMDIVDQMGGVELEISDEEFLVANAYINELNELLDEPYGTDWLPGGGPHLLNGKQALGYSRIRYVGDADFERTKRQRAVLEQIFNKVKDYNLIQLNSLLNIILPEVTTDLTEGEAITLALEMNAYKKYALKQYRLPYDDTWRDMRIKGMSVLGINFEKNIQYLKRDIYAGI
ncbi:MAG: LCP family protein [Lachnospiraceae bacterium]|nr:LCP family protein [Lachnospiraceae bacterium]